MLPRGWEHWWHHYNIIMDECHLQKDRLTQWPHKFQLKNYRQKCLKLPIQFWRSSLYLIHHIPDFHTLYLSSNSPTLKAGGILYSYQSSRLQIGDLLLPVSLNRKSGAGCLNWMINLRTRDTRQNKYLKTVISTFWRLRAYLLVPISKFAICKVY